MRLALCVVLGLLLSTVAMIPDGAMAQTVVAPAVMATEREVRRPPPAELAASRDETKTIIDEIDSNHVAAWTKAARIARDDSAFAERVELASSFPKMLPQTARTDTTSAAVFMAYLASDEERYDEYLDSLSTNIDQASIRADARALATRLDETQQELGMPTEVVVFASGDVRGVATGDSEGGTGSTGYLGVSITKRTTVWNAQIVVASTVDTTTTSFGGALLRPGTGSSLSSGLIDLKIRSGTSGWLWHLYGSATESTWLAEAGTPADSSGNQTVPDSTAKSAVSLGLGALFGRQLINSSVGGNAIGLRLEAGLSLRHLSGDAGRDKAFRTLLLEKDKQFFWGAELGMEISFGSVVAAVQYYVYSGSVDGLTGGQLVAAIGLQGQLFRGRIRQ